MAQPKLGKQPDKIEVEPGADKRLADILKRSLNTQPQHKASAKSKRERKVSR